MSSQPSKPFVVEGASCCEETSGEPACAACDAAYQAGAKFCPQCGRPLSAPLPTAATAPVSRSGGAITKSAEKVNDAQSSPASKPAPPAVRILDKLPAAALSGCGDRDLPAEDHVCPGCGARTGQPLARYRLTRLRLGKEETVAELSGDSVIIGKDDRCDVVIDDDEFVSRRHSRVSRSDGTFFLEDLGSSNGTLLRIRRSIILEAGDEIVIGTTTLRLVQIP